MGLELMAADGERSADLVERRECDTENLDSGYFERVFVRKC